MLIYANRYLPPFKTVLVIFMNVESVFFHRIFYYLFFIILAYIGLCRLKAVRLVIAEFLFHCWNFLSVPPFFFFVSCPPFYTVRARNTGIFSRRRAQTRTSNKLSIHKKSRCRLMHIFLSDTSSRNYSYFIYGLNSFIDSKRRLLG